MEKIQRLVINHKNGKSEFEISDPSAVPLYVTYDDDTRMASHTVQQIRDHVMNGGAVFWEIGGTEIALTACQTNYCLFTEISAEEGYMTQLCVYADGAAEIYEFEFASYRQADGKITAPYTAKVGQTIVVKSVDSNGKPTAWECADLPGNGQYELVYETTNTEPVTSFVYECGNAKNLYVEIAVPANEESSDATGVIKLNNYAPFLYFNKMSSTSAMLTRAKMFVQNGMICVSDYSTCVNSGSVSVVDWGNAFKYFLSNGGYSAEYITRVDAALISGITFPVGTTFKVYEVK